MAAVSVHVSTSDNRKSTTTSTHVIMAGKEENFTVRRANSLDDLRWIVNES